MVYAKTNYRTFRGFRILFYIHNNFLKTNNLLFNSQYVFRPVFSTVDAAKIIKGIDEGQYTLSVNLDLSKAFDSISHGIMLLKLHKYGIRDSVLSWFSSYLSQKMK